MAGGIKVADFYAAIGFQIDTTVIKTLKNKAKEVTNEVKTSAKALADAHKEKAKVVKEQLGLEKKAVQQTAKQAKQKIIDANDYNGHVVAFQKNKIKEEKLAEKERLRSNAKAIKEEQNKQRLARREEAITKQHARRLELQNLRHSSRLKEMELRQNQRMEYAKVMSKRRGRMNPLASFAGGMTGMVRGVIGPALAGYGTFELGKSIFNAAQLKAKTMAALTATTSGPKEAVAQYKFLNSEVDRLSLNLEDASRGFIALKGSAMGSKMAAGDVNKLFSATNEILTVYGATSDDVQGTFRALGQMMSKQTVQSEELKGQLSERVYGAISLAAKSLNMTVQELFDKLKKGDVVATDLLPKLADQFHQIAIANGALDKALDSPQAKLNKFQAKWTNLLIKLSESGAIDMIIGLLDRLGYVMDFVEAHISELQATFGFLGAVIQSVWGIVQPIMSSLSTIFSEFPWIAGGTLAVLAALTTAGTAFVAAWGPIALVIAGVGLVLDDLFKSMRNEGSIVEKWASGSGPLAWLGMGLMFISETVKSLGKGLGAVGASLVALFNLDFAGVGEIWSSYNADLNNSANRLSRAWNGQELQSGTMALNTDGSVIPATQYYMMKSLTDPFNQRGPIGSGVLKQPSAPLQVDLRMTVEEDKFKGYVWKTSNEAINNVIVRDQSSLAGGR